MNRDEWTAFSLQTVGRRQIRTVQVSDLMLLADPVVDGRHHHLRIARFDRRLEGHVEAARADIAPGEILEAQNKVVAIISELRDQGRIG